MAAENTTTPNASQDAAQSAAPDKISLLTKIIERISKTLKMTKGEERGNLSEKAQEVASSAQEKFGEAVNKVTKGKKFQLPENAQQKLDGVQEKIGAFTGKFTKDMDPQKLAKMKEHGLMAGGAVAAVDGVRRIAKKDEDGKCHVVKGALEAGAGVGMFTAAVLARRNGIGNDGPER